MYELPVYIQVPITGEIINTHANPSRLDQLLQESLASGMDDITFPEMMIRLYQIARREIIYEGNKTN